MGKVSVKFKKPTGLLFLNKELKAKVNIAVKEQAYLTANDMKKSIISGSKTGRIYKRGGVSHQSSAHGEAPAQDTGDLASKINSIDVGFAKSQVVAASARAADLEYGTSKMSPRPFARPAVAKNKTELDKELKQIFKNSPKKGK